MVWCLCSRANVISKRPYKKKREKNAYAHTMSNTRIKFIWICELQRYTYGSKMNKCERVEFEFLWFAFRWRRKKSPYFFEYFFFLTIAVILLGRMCWEEKKIRLNCVTYACVFVNVDMCDIAQTLRLMLCWVVLIFIVRYIKIHFDI